MTDDLKELENALRHVQPSRLSPDLLDRLDQAMQKWEQHTPESEEESNVVPFPATQPAKKSWSLFSSQGLSAAAAVAILGASAAVFLTPSTQKPEEAVAQESSSAQQSAPKLNRNFTNVTADRMYWNDDKQPMRQLSLDYVDSLQVTDDQGRVLLLKQPKRRTFLVPLQTD